MADVYLALKEELINKGYAKALPCLILDEFGCRTPEALDCCRTSSIRHNGASLDGSALQESMYWPKKILFGSLFLSYLKESLRQFLGHLLKRDALIRHDDQHLQREISLRIRTVVWQFGIVRNDDGQIRMTLNELKFEIYF
jgi:hypothetical protein